MRAGISRISYLALLLKNALLASTVFMFGGFAYHYWQKQSKKSAEIQTVAPETREIGIDTDDTPPAPPPSLSSTPRGSERDLENSDGTIRTIRTIRKVSSHIFTSEHDQHVVVHYSPVPESSTI